MAELLRVYHSFLRSLAFEQLPELVHRTLGEQGFGPLSRLYAEAVKRYLRRYHPHGGGDPGELLGELKRVASAAVDVLGEEPLFRFDYRVEEGRLLVRVPFRVEGPVDRLRAAVLLGMIAGVLEHTGRRVYVVSSPDRARRQLAGRGVYIVYLEEEGGEARIVAEEA